MKTKALATIEQYKMLEQGDSVCVALSGGADSVALLAFLRDIFSDTPTALSACHLNHNLRGQESLRDENFVRELCKKWNIPLTVRSIQITELAKEQGASVEAAGRSARYGLFAELHERCGCKIATAHTLSDSMETVLFQLARGAGVRGACGISPMRDYIIRPLIGCTRAEIEEFCSENNLEFVNDSTNFTTDYTRNKIRLEVIPKLYEINPALDRAIEGFTDAMNQCYRLIQRLAEEFISSFENEIPCKQALMLDDIVLREVLAELTAKAGGKLSGRHTDICKGLLEKAGAVELGGGILFVSDGISFHICKAEPQAKPWEIALGSIEELWEKLPFNIALPDGKSVLLTSCNYEQTDNFNDQKKLCLKNSAVRGRMYGNVVLRSRKQGDVISIPDRGVTKTLKKLFNEAGIPTQNRTDVAVLADDIGVVWVQGFGTDRRCAPNNSAEHSQIILIELKEDCDNG